MARFLHIIIYKIKENIMNSTIIQIVLIFWSSVLLWIILEYLFYRLNSPNEETAKTNDSRSFAAKK